MSASGASVAPDQGPLLRYLIASSLAVEFEILDAQIWHTEQTAREHETILLTLLALRSTCIEMARTDIIAATVFKEVRFYASQRGTARLLPLARPILSTIAPFVKKVVFLPSPNICDLDLTTFGQVVADLRAHQSNLPLRCKKYIDCYWNGNIPSTDQHISRLWTEYQQRALGDRLCARIGEVQFLWMTALPLFQNADQFEITSLFGRQPLVGRFEIQAFEPCAWCFIIKDRLRDISRTTEAMLFVRSIQCLAAAKCLLPVKKFSINSNLKVDTASWNLVSWDLLDVNAVEKVAMTSSATWDRSVGSAERALAAERGLDQVLRKSLPALKELVIAQSASTASIPLMKWSPNPHLNASNLRVLYVIGVHLFMLPLTSVISNCQQLEAMHIENCSSVATNAAAVGWKELFNAVQRHPNSISLKLVLQDAWEANGVRLSFNYSRTAIPAIGHGVFPEHRSLFLYMAGLGLWDASLIARFGA